MVYVLDLVASEFAEFVFQSPCLPSDYVFRQKYSKYNRSMCPVIKNDLDFMVLVLFRSNTGMGRLL